MNDITAQLTDAQLDEKFARIMGLLDKTEMEGRALSDAAEQDLIEVFKARLSDVCQQINETLERDRSIEKLKSTRGSALVDQLRSLELVVDRMEEKLKRMSGENELLRRRNDVLEEQATRAIRECRAKGEVGSPHGKRERHLLTLINESHCWFKRSEPVASHNPYFDEVVSLRKANAKLSVACEAQSLLIAELEGSMNIASDIADEHVDGVNLPA